MGIEPFRQGLEFVLHENNMVDDQSPSNHFIVNVQLGRKWADAKRHVKAGSRMCLCVHVQWVLLLLQSYGRKLTLVFPAERTPCRLVFFGESPMCSNTHFSNYNRATEGEREELKVAGVILVCLFHQHLILAVYIHFNNGL